MRKMQKIETEQFFLWGMKVLEAVCKAIDTKWGRINFSTCEHFGQISDTVCNVLNLPNTGDLSGHKENHIVL